jgi:alkyl sulfatase BDS1-like metallo-beta-lactamase superfamily hydrolase
MANIKNVNDEKIMEMRKLIEEKKKILKIKKRFNPITNCLLVEGMNTRNIQILHNDDLIELLIRLNSYKMSAEDLKINFTLSGYDINDWITDIKAKIDINTQKEDENKLKVYENRLHDLLSNEKKVALEIENIESMLK